MMMHRGGRSAGRMNDGKLNDEVARGQRAAMLLGDEIVTEALNTIEKRYLDAWRQSDPTDDAKREKLFQMLRALDAFKEHLTSVAQTGDLAAKELRRL